MKYVEAPEEYVGDGRSLFLAGSITGAKDWNSAIIETLRNEDITILNPRRKNFPINDPNASEEQIAWEHRNLRKASAILFWFSNETLAPITLYELGAWSMSEKPLFVGIDPQYQRKRDVEVQTRLTRPDPQIVYSVEDLAELVRKWARE